MFLPRMSLKLKRLSTYWKNFTRVLKGGYPTDEIYLLQKLLTGTAAARPPHAAKHVARLGSPAISVIMPTHNRAQFIGEAIASVQNQSFTDWELLIVDDGSSDTTREEVAPFLADARIRYFYKTQSGGANSRNYGVERSRAPLIAYLDDDNLYYPDFLFRAVDCLATQPNVDFVYGALVTDAHKLNRQCILWQPFDREILKKRNFLDTNVIVHRRELIDKYGGWDENFARLADWDIALRFTVHKPAYALNVLATFYRVCDDQRVSVTLAHDDSDAKIRSRIQES